MIGMSIRARKTMGGKDKATKEKSLKRESKIKEDLKKIKDYAEARKEEKEALSNIKEGFGLKEGYEPELTEQVKEVMRNRDRQIDTAEKEALMKNYFEAREKRKEAEEKIPGKVPKIYEKWGSKEKQILPQAAMTGKKGFQGIYGFKKSMVPGVEKMGLESIKGETLDRVMVEGKMKRNIKNNIEEVTDQIADILVDLTERGVSHTDIHAENLIVSEESGKPRVTLIDFELAELTSSIVNTEHTTRKKENHMTSLRLTKDFNDTVKNLSKALELNPDKFREELGKRYQRKIEKRM